MFVATAGEGIPVFESPASKRQIGMLYNGYEDSLRSYVDGKYSCTLTEDTIVWIDMEKAMSKLPKEAHESPSGYEDLMPCNCFLAEVVTDQAKVYSGTGHDRVLAEHVKGTLVLVYGSFGSDWFVWCCGLGFIPKSDVQKVKDLTFLEIHSGTYGYTGLQIAEVYADSNKISLKPSATGISEERDGMSLKPGDQLMILRDLGDWVQVAVTDQYRGYPLNGFLEKRFIDPNADHALPTHAYPTAVVKTTHPLNRLIIRTKADENSNGGCKLCSGAEVLVVSKADGWTEILLEDIGQDENNIHGFVMSKYLIDGTEADKAKNACVKVRILRDYKLYQYDFEKNRGSVSAGTEATVIGVSYVSNKFLLRLDNGRLIFVDDNQPEPILEPIDPIAWKAKTTKKIAFRAGPCTEAKKLRTLNSGTSIEVLLRGEQWALIRYKGETGYILSNALKPVK